MITIWDYEQGSTDWHRARLGLITASRVADVLSTGTGRARYMRELAAEVLTGGVADSYTNAAMQWGTETEPQARAYYELMTGVDVIETGFVTNSDYPGCGISPDGMIGDDGLLEIKCPNTTTMVEYLLADKAPAKYRHQVQMQLLITQRHWCDFMVFDPRIIHGTCYGLWRVERDAPYMKDKLIPGINKFLGELDDMMRKLR